MSSITFKPGSRAESDKWSLSGEAITSSENFENIRAALNVTGPILVQHKFLRGGCAPTTIVFDEFDAFTEYLSENARAGDKITVWSLWPFMRDTLPLAQGKCPDSDGAVPEFGPY